MLTQDGHAGEIYEMTGPSVVTFRGVASILSNATGRTIKYLPISFDAFRHGLEEVSDKQYADIVTRIAMETFDGRNAHVAKDIERILGRPANDFKSFAYKVARRGCWALSKHIA